MVEERDQIVTRLYCKFKQELYLFARQYCPDDAEDIVHQAFVNCYERLIADKNEASQRAYLYSTVKNLCLNFLRNTQPVYTDVLPEVSLDMIVVDAHDYMYEYIDKLPGREREILLQSLQGYSTKEISENMEMEYNTVRHYKKEAYAKMRNALKKDL